MRSSRSATSTASPSCPSAAGRRSSAAWIPSRARIALVIALDLERTAALLELDETSLLATFGAGTTGPQAEELLAARGYTLGHFPQSFEYATIGGFAATRSSGQASRGYGRFDDLVHALRVATPVGELSLGRAPASAAGPDLRELFLGSEGAFGVLTEVTVRIRPVAAVTRYGAWTFPDFASGAEAVRLLTQRGIRPTVLRLSDETETRVNAAMGAHLTRLRGCLAVATFEGATPDEAEVAADATDTVFAAHGAQVSRRGSRALLGTRPLRLPGAARRTARCRRAGRDAGDRLARGRGLPGLKRAVTDALTAALTADGTKPIVLCHISHVYPAGASLYFTVVAALTDDPLANGEGRRMPHPAPSEAPAAPSPTTMRSAATTAPTSKERSAPLGIDILRAVKTTLDPRGIMNPGALVAPPTRRRPAPRATTTHERHAPREPGRARRCTLRCRGGGRGAAAIPAASARRSSAGAAPRSPATCCARRSGSAPMRSSSPAATAPSTSPSRSSPAPASRSASSRQGPATTSPRRWVCTNSTSRRPPRPSRRAARGVIDLGRVTRADGTSSYFGSVLASGFDSKVNDRANAMRWPRGSSRYNIAILVEFLTLAGIPYEVELELEDGTRERVAGDLVMATVGNGRTYGGGIPICPDADPADGLLDVVARAARRPAATAATAAARLQGTHAGVAEVSMRRVRSVRLSAPGVTAYADGDPIGALPLTIDVVPRSLTVFAPE